LRNAIVGENMGAEIWSLWENSANRRVIMEKSKYESHFGVISISKKFITLEQFAEAMKIQAKEDLAKQEHRLIGEILVDLGIMNTSQVDQVLGEMEILKEAYLFKCPSCGVYIYKCPNCGSVIRK